jgi:hypothetical protein
MDSIEKKINETSNLQRDIYCNHARQSRHKILVLSLVVTALYRPTLPNSDLILVRLSGTDRRLLILSKATQRPGPVTKDRVLQWRECFLTSAGLNIFLTSSQQIVPAYLVFL